MWRANAGLWRRWLSLLLLLPGLGGLGLLLAAVAPAGAQTTTVPLSSSVDYTFGQAMHFRLRGESDTPVEGATLTWSLQGDGQRHEVPLALLPGRVVSVTYTLHLTDSPLPPFSTVYYQWRLATPAGPAAAAYLHLPHHGRPAGGTPLERPGPAGRAGWAAGTGRRVGGRGQSAHG